MRIVIVGGGAAGLMAAISAKNDNNEVIVLERNNKCGKKLLLTGNGRANFWNEDQELKHYHTKQRRLLKPFIDANKDQILPFFSSLGLVYRNIGGYYYPYTNQASSLVNVLLCRIKALGIEVVLDAYVEKIVKKDHFIITTPDREYIADKVILAMGSKSYPKTGSDGQGYEIVSHFNHHLVSVTPALVALKGRDSYYKEWEGTRSEARLSLYIANEFIRQEQGEVQFTDYGISGICVFNLSGDIAELQDFTKAQIMIDFLPWFNESDDDFVKWVDQISKKLNCSVSQLFDGFLNYKITNLVLKLLHINADSSWKDVDKKAIVSMMRRFPFNVFEPKSFDTAQVCRGGIPLDEVDMTTMESKKVQGLYLTGEILDADGDCGGYNLGFAFMSGMVAGKSAQKDKNS